MKYITSNPIKHRLETWRLRHIPDSKVHVAHVGPTWVLLAPGGPRVGPMNLSGLANSFEIAMLQSLNGSDYLGTTAVLRVMNVSARVTVSKCISLQSRENSSVHTDWARCYSQ